MADLIGQALSENQPGGIVVGLLHDDSTSVLPFGTADSTGTTPTAHTLFEIGSIAETFTGLLLVERVTQAGLRLIDADL